MATKEVVAQIKVQVPGGEATPASSVGPALGQHGVPIMDFCKAFNAQTMEKKGTVFPVVITVYKDKSFTFIVKEPPVSDMIRKALGIEKGSGTPHKDFVGTLSVKQLRDIAEAKMQDLNARTIEAAMKIVAGSARSMGVEVEREEEK